MIGIISMPLIMMNIQNNIPQFRICSTNLKNLKVKFQRERILKILGTSWKFQLSYLILTIKIKIKKEVLGLKKKIRETILKIIRGTQGCNNSCRQLKKIASTNSTRTSTERIRPIMINRKNLEIIINLKIILKNLKCRRDKSNQSPFKDNQPTLSVLLIQTNYIRILIKKITLIILKAAIVWIKTTMKQKNNKKCKKNLNIILRKNLLRTRTLSQQVYFQHIMQINSTLTNKRYHSSLRKAPLRNLIISMSQSQNK